MCKHVPSFSYVSLHAILHWDAFILISVQRWLHQDFCVEVNTSGLEVITFALLDWFDYIYTSFQTWLHMFILHLYLWHLDFLYWLYFDIYTGLRTNNSPHYICSSVYPELISSGPRHWGDCNCHSVMRWTRLDVGMWWLILYRVLQNAEMIITWPLW